MLGTSKGRKPPRPAKCRRVSFAEPSTDERSKEAPSTESFTACLKGIPEPTAAPYDGTAHLSWAPSNPDYVGGGAQSMTTLMGGPPPTGHFAEQPAVPPSPYWMMTGPPPFGPHAEPFEHYSDAHVFPEEAHDEPGNGALPSLSSFCVTVLVAAVVTVAVVVALTMDLQGSFVRPQTSSASSGIGMGADRIIAPPEAMDLPVKVEPRGHARPVVPAEEATRAHFEWETSTHPRLRQQLLRGTRRLKQRRQCGAHFYSYCEQASGPEAYYSSASHRCVSTAGDGAHVCNRGANRFADFKSCLASCVYRGGRQPASDRCFDITLFTGCSRQDVVEDWWFFDGSSCAHWNFPLGKCPSQGSTLFRTREDCDETCLQQRDGRDRCDVPVAATCSPWQIKFPYFADMRAQGHARCVKASSRTLLTRRCLIGSNRFESLARCDRVCGSPRIDPAEHQQHSALE